MMHSTRYDLPNTGLTKHKMVRDLEIDSVPKLLFSKTFGYSDSVTYMVLESLERLYKNPMIKPIMDVIAVRIIKNEVTRQDLEKLLVPNLFVPQEMIQDVKNARWDDFYIKFDPLLNRDAGLCNQGKSKLTVTTSIDNNGSSISQNTTTISADVIHIGLHHDESHDPQELDETLSHEMTHAAMGIVFDNEFNPYPFEKGRISNQQRLFENGVRDLMEKIAYFTNPTLSYDLNSSLSGIELFRLFVSEMRYVASKDKKDNPEDDTQAFKDLVSFLDELLPLMGYTDDKIHGEIIARLFHVHTLSSTALSTKVMKVFDPYMESLNKSIDQYMEQEAQYIPEYVHKNADGSYGVPTYWKKDAANSFDDGNTKLYMAIIKHEFETAKGLLEKGADVCANPLVAPILGIVIRKNDVEAAKFIAENVKSINLDATNIRGHKMSEYLERDNDAAHILHEKYMPKVHEHIEVQSVDGIMNIEGHAGFQDALVSQQPADTHNA